MNIERIDYRPESFLPPHTHDDWHLIVVVRGGLIERARGTVRNCATRTALLRSAGELHSNEIGRTGCTCLAASVPRELLGSQPATRLAAGGRVTHLAARLAEESSSRDPFAPLAAQGIVLEILAELCRGTRETRAIPAAVATGRDMLAARCTSPVHIDEIAREVGLEPVRFARLFRRAYDCTPSDFVRAERVARACEALRTGMPLAEAAQRAGFYDQSHFCNVFRRVTGMTPGAWRKSLQKR